MLAVISKVQGEYSISARGLKQGSKEENSEEMEIATRNNTHPAGLRIDACLSVFR